MIGIQRSIVPVLENDPWSSYQQSLVVKASSLHDLVWLHANHTGFHVTRYLTEPLFHNSRTSKMWMWPDLLLERNTTEKEMMAIERKSQLHTISTRNQVQSHLLIATSYTTSWHDDICFTLWKQPLSLVFTKLNLWMISGISKIQILIDGNYQFALNKELVDQRHVPKHQQEEVKIHCVRVHENSQVD